MERLQRRGFNHTNERAGIAVGLAVGVGLGLIVSRVTDPFIPVLEVLGGAALGATIGAGVGARVERPWADVPVERGAVGLRRVVRL